MTIALGILADEGPLLCADSQFTSASKVNRDKVFTWAQGYSVVCFAITGNEANGRMAIQDCEEAMEAVPIQDRTINVLRKVIRSVLKPLQEQYVDRVPPEERDLHRFDFVIGIATRADARGRLFYTESGAVVETSDFVCVGTGGYLGDYVIRKAFERGMSVDRAIVLAMQGLAAAKDHDAYSGGYSQFVTIRDGLRVSGIVPYNVGLAEEAILRYEQRVSKLLLKVFDVSLTDDDFTISLERFNTNLADMREAVRREGEPLRQLIKSLRVDGTAVVVAPAPMVTAVGTVTAVVTSADAKPSAQKDGHRVGQGGRRNSKRDRKDRPPSQE